MAPRRGPAPPRPAPPAPARADWAELPGELLEKVGRAVPAGGRLWYAHKVFYEYGSEASVKSPNWNKMVKLE